MAVLNRNLVGIKNRPIKIIQFGCSARIRGTLDYAIQQMNEDGSFDGGIGLVTDTQSGKGGTLYKQDGRYTISFSGELKEGMPHHKIVSCIERFFDVFENYAEFLHEAESKHLEYIVTETGKHGITYDPTDSIKSSPRTLPVQLCAFLYHRYTFYQGDFYKGLKVISFEDMEQNGDHLRAFVLRVAREQIEEEAFITWLDQAVQFFNTKVTRQTKDATKEEVQFLNHRKGYTDHALIKVDYPSLWFVVSEDGESPLPVHEEMPWEVVSEFPKHKKGVLPRIDLHCDTLVNRVSKLNESLYENEGHLDLKRLSESGAFLQDFAIYLTQDFDPDMEKVYEEFKRVRGLLSDAEKEYSDTFSMVYSKRDLQRNFLMGKLSGLLSIEDCAMVNGKIERIEELYNQGVRLMTLTWNYENCMGYPNSKDEYTMNRGLKPFGLEAIQKMNELGIVIDVSHLSDGGFWDVIQHSKKPVMASHSNARALTPATRNMTDDMIQALAQNKGVMGMNFCPYFVGEKEDEMHLEDLVKHILHIRKVGGIDVIALGSDFDGIPGKLDIADCTEYYKLEEALREAGLKNEEIEKIWYKNAMRVLEANLK